MLLYFANSFVRCFIYCGVSYSRISFSFLIICSSLYKFSSCSFLSIFSAISFFLIDVSTFYLYIFTLSHFTFFENRGDPYYENLINRFPYFFSLLAAIFKLNSEFINNSLSFLLLVILPL